MNITAARLHHYALPLRTQWQSAAGGFTVRKGCLLRLDTDNGLSGYGDYAPLGQLTTQSLARQALAICGQAASSALHTLEPASASATPEIRCAIECALLDLLAQSARKTLNEYLGGSGTPKQIPVNAALGSLSVLDEHAIRNACREGYSVLKIKVGCTSLDEEIARLHALARGLPESVRLRLDANRAWLTGDARRFLQACTGLPIEHCEEPLRAMPDASSDWLLPLAKLQATTSIPLAVDESWNEKIADRFFALRPVNKIILKPPRLGGLLPALALARRAAGEGVACIVTSSMESACGVLAAAHVAAALDDTLAHGLSTSCWLLEDTGIPPAIAGGTMTLPEHCGLGFRPAPDLEFRCAALATPAKG